MLNSTMQSTKSGGPLAAAWAVGQWIGVEGYGALAVRARGAALEIARRAPGIPGVRLLVAPDSTLVTLTTDDSCDVFTIADEMLSRGGTSNPRWRMPGRRRACTSPSAATAESVDEFVAALAEATQAARAAGPVSVDSGLAAAAVALDPETLSDNDFDGLLALAGLADGDGALELPSGWRRSTPCSTWRRRGCVSTAPRLPRPPVATHGTMRDQEATDDGRDRQARCRPHRG